LNFLKVEVFEPNEIFSVLIVAASDEIDDISSYSNDIIKKMDNINLEDKEVIFHLIKIVSRKFIQNVSW
jgi:hypothetical protein